MIPNASVRNHICHNLIINNIHQTTFNGQNFQLRLNKCDTIEFTDLSNHVLCIFDFQVILRFYKNTQNQKSIKIFF